MNTPAVILVRPREEGNVGAVARAMANMGLERLILVEPAPQLAGVARGFGVGGWTILERAESAGSLAAAIAAFGRVVGTASRRQRPLSSHRVITPRQLPGLLAADPVGTETALVFGPEDNGLSRSELERCSPVVSVPCHATHPTLNLAQAVLVLAYELHVASREEEAPAPAAETGEEDSLRHLPLATASEIEALRRQSTDLLLRIGYDQQPIRDGILRDLRGLMVRAAPRDREIRLLRRLINRATRAMARRAAPSEPE